MNQYKTAVVGLNMGLAHAYAYRASERSELTYVVDLDEAKAAKVAQELGCRYATDWTEILDEIDAVSLCTPHHLHASQALTAIAAGKHVILEKPLANSEEECLEVTRAAEEKGVTLMLAYVVRYMPAIQKLKEAIESGRYGTPIHAECWVLGYLPPMPPQSWFSKKKTLGGGVLFSHGCHYIDILLWLLGNPRRVVSLGTRVGTEWLEGEGTAHSTIEFENGALGHLNCSWGTRMAEPPARFHIYTTNALLVVSNDMWTLEAVTEAGRETLYAHPESEKSQPEASVKYEIEHFLECVSSGKPPETDGHEAMKSHRTIWSMYGENSMTDILEKGGEDV